jgi:hypothetical protein
MAESTSSHNTRVVTAAAGNDSKPRRIDAHFHFAFALHFTGL